MAEASLSPVRDALQSAFKERCEQLKELLPSQSEWNLFVSVIPGLVNHSGGASSGDLQQATQVWQKITRTNRLLEEVKELDSWLHRGLTTTERETGASRLAALLLSNGMDFGDVEEAVKSARSRLRGAPVTRRQAAVKALDMRRLKPSLSWMQVTRKCCDCEEQSHNNSCMQVLRQEVMALEKVLQRYDIHPRKAQTKPANQGVKKSSQ
jgi:hypothetical protein